MLTTLSWQHSSERVVRLSTLRPHVFLCITTSWRQQLLHTIERVRESYVLPPMRSTISHARLHRSRGSQRLRSPCRLQLTWKSTQQSPSRRDWPSNKFHACVFGRARPGQDFVLVRKLRLSCVLTCRVALRLFAQSPRSFTWWPKDRKSVV